MRDHLIEGLDLQAKRDYVGAFDSYVKASKLVPSNPIAYLNTGNIFTDLVVWDRAIELYKVAIKLDPKYAKAHLNLGYAYWQDGQPVLAEEMYNKAIDLMPRNPIAYMDRGIIALQNGNYNRAAFDFDTAIDFDPNYAFAYMNRGRVYHATGSYDLAIKYYSIALSLDKSCPFAADNRNLATAKKSIGKVGSPIHHIAPHRKKWDSKTIDSLRTDILAADAARRLQFNDYKKAIDECTLALSLDPENSDAYLYRGGALVASLKSSEPGFADGVQDLQKCNQLHPESVFVHIYLGDANIKMNRIKEARSSYATFLKRATRDVDAALIKAVKSICADIDTREKEKQDAIRRGDMQIITPPKANPGR
ncbi:MAG: tetratricopeptide repeat protein [Armatimonadota bacterium]